MRYFVTIAGRTLEVELSGGAPVVDGVEMQAEMRALPGSAVRHLLVDGRSRAFVTRRGERQGAWEISIGGERLEVEVVDERTRAIRELTGAGEEVVDRSIRAPMPGMVVRVEVEQGQRVKAGQGVAVVEAMKMENELKAPADGVVVKVLVSAGQTVEKGSVLVELE
jgi:biotin carboxyl carrier protein